MGDVIFDVLLVVSTMIAAWLWVRDPIAKITAEVMLAIPNAFAIYFYHRHLKDLPLDNFKPWLLSLAGSAVFTFVFSRFEPVWWDFAVLFVRGHQEQALSLLDTQPHANLPMFIGLFGVYASLAGLARLALKRLIKVLYPGLSDLQKPKDG